MSELSAAVPATCEPCKKGRHDKCWLVWSFDLVHDFNCDCPHVEAKRLHAVWKVALSKHHRAGTITTMNAEQAAHDALVDYVEAHDLIDSEYDPRTGNWMCPHCRDHYGPDDEDQPPVCDMCKKAGRT